MTEERRLQEQRQQLGYDPTLHADRLNPGRTHTKDGKPVKTSTKRVLEALTNGDHDRRRACFESCDLDQLVDRGELTGLTDFLKEVVRLADQLAVAG